MKKKNIYSIIAIISTLGILCWMTTDYFGGMFIYLLSYGLIIIPIIILYVISFFDTFISIIKNGIKQNLIKVIFHSLVLIAILLTNIFNSEMLKSNKILTATLKDDQSYFILIFRENGNCENEVSGMFGFHQTFQGKYKFYGDTIIFTKKPYDNDFIPDTLLIDRKAKAIFIEKDKKGNFNVTKEWLNHFEIK
ncbi:hypothetical protein ABF176_002289 [Flavobacterium psychrophilum]|nr:hypothetical protein [Flavobacterium psychrophilum]EKT4499989.1 hypothetical protein [Flavobacterium psychrophilum]EKT4550780.1 hypothetical protein [Flavobacterium psychrophilum]EKT4553272.1 hypothetical protein [Flavobacterium psychrophilum]ELM3645106.1 hypothetical protein [Flavobacterium psychrophilum]ELM3651562.1 hypothetical protein [Flavobacterium psychrophilum]